MKTRAAIYCRLSKEDTDKGDTGQESQSIINQTMMLLDYIEQRGFELYDIYKDDDYSGLYDDRPGFERLIKDAGCHMFDVIVAKSQSRFTRNIEHLEKYLHHDFPLWGIRFIGVVDNVDTEIKGNKKARQINGLINEWYCEDLSESIKASFRIKQKNGQFIGSSAPYGYVKDGDNRHRLVVDPYAADIVRRIFYMYLSGIGKAKIGRILTDEGVLIPTEYKRQVLKQNYHNGNQKYGRQSKWSFQTVNTILHNEVYIGNLVQNKCCKKSYKDKKKKNLPEEEWIRAENTHEPIIDIDMFRDVQEQLKSRSRPVNIPESGENLFAGRLFCGECGRPMTPYYSKASKNTRGCRRYVCSEYKKYGRKYCGGYFISEEMLKTILLRDLRAQAEAILSDERKEFLKGFRCIAGNRKTERNPQRLNDELMKTEDYKAKMFENFADGILSREEYLKLKERYDKKEQELQECIWQNEKHGAETCEKTEFETWLQNFTDNFNVAELTREMILNLVDAIHIYENDTVEIKYRFMNGNKKIQSISAADVYRVKHKYGREKIESCMLDVIKVEAARDLFRFIE